MPGTTKEDTNLPAWMLVIQLTDLPID